MTVLKNSIYAYGIITTLVFVTSSGNRVSPTLDQERKFADYAAMLKESLKLTKETWPNSSSDWHTVFKDDTPLPVSTEGNTNRRMVLVSPTFKPVTKHYDLTELIKLTKRAEEVIRRTEEGLRNVSFNVNVIHRPIDYKFPEPAFDHPVKFPDTPRHFPTQGTTKRPWVVITRIKTTQKPMITRNREHTDTNYWGELGRNLRNLETWTLNSTKTSFTAVYNWLHGN